MRAIALVSVLFFSMTYHSQQQLWPNRHLLWDHGVAAASSRPTTRPVKKPDAGQLCSRASTNSFTANYRCSSSIGSATQHVRVRKVGANSYTDHFTIRSAQCQRGDQYIGPRQQPERFHAQRQRHRLYQDAQDARDCHQTPLWPSHLSPLKTTVPWPI